MITAPLDVVPLWFMFFAFAGFLWLAMEGGYRLGKWRRLRISDEKEQPVGAMVASILGLVALVLGFTFSLAASRFDARRMAVLEESNAIGTTYLRARLLPEPERSEIQRLLREYVEVRIQGVEEGKTEQALTRSEALHELLWAQAVAAAEKDSGSIMAGVFVQSLNDTIDLHAKRVLVGLRSRIPLVIWIGLFGLAMLGMAAVGYQAALCITRRSPAMLALVLAFAVVLLLIADLDRGNEGLMRISQHSMLDLQDTIESPTTDEHQEPSP
jgi:drug/metabolite transporter (DMT)-like permease